MTQSTCWYSSPTQINWSCKVLTEGRTVTHKTEIREAKGWRLVAVMERVRKRYGWPILIEYRGPENVAHYRLQPGADIAQLRYPPCAARLAQGGAQ